MPLRAATGAMLDVESIEILNAQNWGSPRMRRKHMPTNGGFRRTAATADTLSARSKVSRCAGENGLHKNMMLT